MNYYARVAELYTQLANIHWQMARNELDHKILPMPEPVIEEPPIPVTEAANEPTVPDEEALRKVAMAYAKAKGKDVAKAIIAKYADNLKSVAPEDRHALISEMEL